MMGQSRMFDFCFLFQTLTLRRCSVNTFLYLCPTQSVDLTEHGLNETFDSITPHSTKSKAFIINVKSRHAIAQ